MDFLELAKKRYSVRSFQAKKVEEEKLLKILEAGRVAPTGCNKQPQRIIVVQKEEGLLKLNKAARLYSAPMALIVCGSNASAWKRPFDGKNIMDIDISIVTDHMMLQATELGLGTLWICYFKPEVVKHEFKLPDDIVAVNILCIGYGDGKFESADRHDLARNPLSETVFYESF